MAITVTLEAEPRRPGRYRAIHDGRILCVSAAPGPSAARALLSEGVPPETWLVMVSSAGRMRTTVGFLAGFTMSTRLHL